jgi:hypothetical protein
MHRFIVLHARTFVLLHFICVQGLLSTVTQRDTRRKWHQNSAQSRPALGPIQPRYQGSFTEVNRPRREADHLRPWSGLNHEWSYTAAPPMCRNCLCTGTTLPLT